MIKVVYGDSTLYNENRILIERILYLDNYTQYYLIDSKFSEIKFEDFRICLNLDLFFKLIKENLISFDLIHIYISLDRYSLIKNKLIESGFRNIYHIGSVKSNVKITQIYNLVNTNIESILSTHDLFSFSEKNILITGVSAGLGMVLVKHFLKLGCNVYGVSRSEVNINFNKNKMKNIVFDLQDTDKLLSKINEICINKDIDILINNAAINLEGGFDIPELFEIKFINMIKTNYISHCHITNIVLNGMIKRNFGRVINITSSLRYSHKDIGYISTKLINDYYFESLSNLYKNYNINFISINPGHIQTRMTDYIAPLKPESIFPVLEIIRLKRKFINHININSERYFNLNLNEIYWDLVNNYT